MNVLTMCFMLGMHPCPVAYPHTPIPAVEYQIAGPFLLDEANQMCLVH